MRFSYRALYFFCGLSQILAKGVAQYFTTLVIAQLLGKMREKIKKSLALGLVIIMVMSLFTGFTYVNGFGNVYFQSEKEIFDGVTYSEIIGSHPSNGIEHAYTVTADLSESSLSPLVFTGEVKSESTVGSMVSYAENQGYKVVAAINGDIYDMSSGTPKNPVIHEYNLVTSGYAADRVIAFDADGAASMKSASLTYKMEGTACYTTTVTEEITPPGTEDDSESLEEDKAVSAETAEAGEDAGASETAEALDDSTEPKVQTRTYEITEEKPWSANAGYFNVIQGSSQEISIYNRHFASSTGTKGNRVEVVIDCSDYGSMQLQVNKTTKGIVKSVNTSTHNTAIGSQQIVLSVAETSPLASSLAALKVGSEFSISVEDQDNCGLENAKEAVGLYYSIVEDGKVVTSGTNTNPRTVLGIKDDGSLVLYVVDGRQSSISKGLGLIDTAKHMIDLGCTYAFNLDGGGSSTIYARMAGVDKSAVLKNSPSGGSQRKVANCIILAYTDTASSSAAQLNLYPALSLVMPGATAQITTYASNSLYEKASVPSNISYDATLGSISASGLFTAGDTAGTAEITARAGNVSGSTQVKIVDDFTINPSVSKLTLEAGQSSDINITAKYGTIKVASNDNLFAWSCDENIGTIDANGKFTAVSTAYTNLSGNIYVSYKDKKVSIPVTIGATIVDFDDTKDHWARTYIGSLAGRGIVDGMGNNLFEPEGTLTRAQFLAMLAKSLYNIDVAAAKPAGFSDVGESDWYYGYVNWGFENGIVNGVSEESFAPDSKITREQMAVMLCNFANYLGLAIPQTASEAQFTDSEAISSWSTDYVRTVVGGGIMNGMSDGSFSPQSTATRAQAAKVIYIFSNIKDGIQ